LIPITDSIKKLNKFVSDNQEFVYEIGQSLENIGGSQGYFDGSISEIQALHDCLKTKNVIFLPPEPIGIGIIVLPMANGPSILLPEQVLMIIFRFPLARNFKA
jgi:hypothetical protein